ncbi:MAG: hypothetical protein LBP55_07820 [Candidatus Adiutrix sp.]|jgi:hypothetical protein|nr:hypothetical protein [Candidatus Adiutrix sp.]
MTENYARILGDHTADVIRRISDLKPTEIRITSQPTALPACELAVRIDFQGQAEGRELVTGYVMCGFIHHNQSRPLLQAMAHHLCFDKSLLATAEGPVNVMKEFLNIIIGLAGADWAEQGFEMNFSTPSDLSGQPLPPLGAADAAYHLVVLTDAGVKVDILAVFRECE